MIVSGRIARDRLTVRFFISKRSATRARKLPDDLAGPKFYPNASIGAQA